MMSMLKIASTGIIIPVTIQLPSPECHSEGEIETVLQVWERLTRTRSIQQNPRPNVAVLIQLIPSRRK